MPPRDRTTLWNVSGLVGYTIEADDGFIGSLEEFLFDDRDWTIRWLAVETGLWLPGRQVILPPSVFEQPDPARRAMPARLTKQQVKDAPPIDAAGPVLRRHEADIFAYYRVQPYWDAGSYAPPAGVAVPGPIGVHADMEAAGSAPPPTLCSTRGMTGFHVQASDGGIGHIEDFLVDTGNWSIQSIVIDTRDWWPGKKVRISPKRLTDLDFDGETIGVDLTRQEIEQGPQYDPHATAGPAYRDTVPDFYWYPHL